LGSAQEIGVSSLRTGLIAGMLRPSDIPISKLEMIFYFGIYRQNRRAGCAFLPNYSAAVAWQMINAWTLSSSGFCELFRILYAIMKKAE